MKDLLKLNRQEMKNIRGGADNPPSTCSTTCSPVYSIECSGSSCTVVDGVSCKSDTETKYCPL